MITTQTNTVVKDALNIAIAMRAEGRHDETLLYLEHVQPFFQDTLNLRRFFNGLGQTYYGLGNYEKAVSAYESALDMPTTDEDLPAEMAVIQANLADSLIALERLDTAHVLLGLAERTLKATGSDDWLANCLETHARVYLKEGRLEHARDAIKRALDIHWYGVETKALMQTLQTLVAVNNAILERQAA